MKKFVQYTIIAVLLGVIALFYNLNNKKPGIITKSDTITVRKTDTITIRKPKLVTTIKLKTERDTLLLADTVNVPVIVNIPISQKRYNSSAIIGKDTVIADTYVKGYKTSLDSIHFKLSRSTQIITNTIIKQKQKRFSLGLQVGCTFSNATFSPYVGIGVQYNLLNLW